MLDLSNSDQQPDQPMTVLVVDDTAVARQLIKRTLSRVGFSVLSAGDGDAAIRLLRRFNVDAIVTDLEMPKVGGDELVEQVRNSEIAAHRAIPIVVVSSKADPVTRVKLRGLGANAFLSKPIDSRALRAIVTRVFLSA